MLSILTFANAKTLFSRVTEKINNCNTKITTLQKDIDYLKEMDMDGGTASTNIDDYISDFDGGGA